MSQALETTNPSQKRTPRQERRRALLELRREQKKQGLEPAPKPSLSNSLSEWKTLEEEKEARQSFVEGQLHVFRPLIVPLFKRFAKIEDPRNPKTLRHKLTALLLYALFAFVYQRASRRDANRTLTQPQFQANLLHLFPELGEALPHQDTVNRVLSRINVEELQDSFLELYQRLLRNKKFSKYLVDQGLVVAIDGTQKAAWSQDWDSPAPSRTVHTEAGEEVQYYVYVLEANLVLPNGLTLPLLSEFLRLRESASEQEKQDCELKAFYRLAKRIKENFPRLRLTVLLDGLYPNGPLFAVCRKYHWQFLIVLKDEQLPSVWEEYRGLSQLHPENLSTQTWGDRRQTFRWVNHIAYEYGPNGRCKQEIHVVTCEEVWTVVDPQTNTPQKRRAFHAWVSSKPLHKGNVHLRCNLLARHRWAIENNILVEKHQGYAYEHCFSYNWNALKGYHYLMRIAHFFNQFLRLSVQVAETITRLGVRPFLRWLQDTMTGPWIDYERIRPLLEKTPQLRLL